MGIFNDIDTILFDMDGTIYFKGKPIPGAISTITSLRERGFKLSFITNTDGRSPVSIHRRLQVMGFDISLDEVFTPVVAVKAFFENNPGKTCYCLVSDEVYDCLKELNMDEKKPDYVVIGDFSDKLNYDQINRVFRFLMNGSNILALSKTMYYFSQDGISINTGAFVRMFECACGRDGLLLGKPSADFFSIALGRLGSRPEKTMVVGDDITVDIEGARAIGSRSVLVRTGHFCEGHMDLEKVRPDYIIDDVSSLKGIPGPYPGLHFYHTGER